jgi:signal transduction histidine kinase
MARETAHQLGTPVSALMGWVDWLKEHPEKTGEIIPEMEADLQRLEQIGRRFSKMGSKTDFEELDLSERVQRVVDYLAKRMPSLGKKVELINDIQPGIIINANGSLLAWSIENLIRNGIDAIDREDGKVRLSLRKESGEIKIRIQDNGKGIPKKDWRNIFRPGFSTKQTGWGLGLSLSSRIVEDIHHGKIQVIESSPETGTVIEITL